MKKSLLWLGFGYIAGVAAAIVTKNDKFPSSFSEFRDEFVNLHKDIWNRINELELSDEVRTQLSSIRNRLKEEIAYMEEDFSQEIARLKEIGSPNLDDIRSKIEDVYSRREEHINAIKSEAEIIIEKLKRDGNHAYQILESSIRDIFEDTRYRIESKAAEVKNKLKR